MSVANSAPSLSETARTQLKDCSRIIIFKDDLSVLYSNFEVSAAELRSLTLILGDRDNAMRNGMIIQGKRYEVHRHHPPLVYGRSMSEEPEQSEGAAICRVEKGPGGLPAYAVITYEMPNVSARMVHLLRDFCEKELAQT